MDDAQHTGSKEASIAPEARRRTLIRDNPVVASGLVGERIYSLVGFAAAVGDAAPPWGTAIGYRDIMLRRYALAEPFLASASASIVARNASFTYTLESESDELLRIAEDIIEGADQGMGWVDFVVKTGFDLYWQDKGAFIHTMRMADNPMSPVVGIEHLDAGRCWLTGNRERPVIYQDRFGELHELRWWNVVHLSEMPMPMELLNGLQMSAVTRVLKQARIFESEETYTEEKVSGQFTRAIHVIQGVAQEEIDDALKMMQMDAIQRLQQRYIQPAIVAAIDPQTKPELVTLEMAGLPDGWDVEKELRRYLTVLSLGFLTDYQEFAPLPSAALGSAMQSEVLDEKGRLKGAGLWRKMMERAFNRTGILPPGVALKFDVQDLDEEKKTEEVRKTRAETVKILIDTMVIDDVAARQMLVDAGDLDEAALAELETRMEQKKLEQQAVDEERRQFDREMAVAQLNAQMNVGAKAHEIEPVIDENKRQFEDMAASDIAIGLGRLRRRIERRIGA